MESPIPNRDLRVKGAPCHFVWAQNPQSVGLILYGHSSNNSNLNNSTISIDWCFANGIEHGNDYNGLYGDYQKDPMIVTLPSTVVSIFFSIIPI